MACDIHRHVTTISAATARTSTETRMARTCVPVRATAGDTGSATTRGNARGIPNEEVITMTTLAAICLIALVLPVVGAMGK